MSLAKASPPCMFIDVECPHRIDGCRKINVITVNYYRSSGIESLKCVCLDVNYKPPSASVIEWIKLGLSVDEIYGDKCPGARYWAVYDKYGGIECTDVKQGLMCRACFEGIINDYKEGRRQLPPEEKKGLSRDDSTAKRSPGSSDEFKNRDIKW